MSAEALEQLAIDGWRAIHGSGSGPQLAGVLLGLRRETSVYELSIPGLGHPVVAKRSARSTATSERLVYEEILDGSGVESAAYHGAYDEPDSDMSWIFLEKVYGNAHREDNATHRALLGQWLGDLHAIEVPERTLEQLPVRDLPYYRSLLSDSRGRLSARAASDSTTMLEQLERLDQSWDQLAERCAGAAPQLVHGDLVSHNIFVRGAAQAQRSVVIDWGNVGWGLAAEDLAAADLGAYQRAVRDAGPADLAQRRRAGRIFRCLVFLDWLTGQELTDPSVTVCADLQRCGGWLDSLLGDVLS